jgi:sterol desaturase/sphingolipid hydroxylase (fatty acid hydroxylase superfamily)
MELWLTDRVRLAILVVACAGLWSIEALIPLFEFGRGRWRRALPNFALTVGVLVTNLVFASMLASLSAILIRDHFGLLTGVRAPAWLQLSLAVAGLDFFAYVAHLLLHKIPLGWKFHQVHHSEREVDVTTALRQHPGETVWRIFWQFAGMALLGLPFWVVPVYLTVSTTNALLEHANVRMNHHLDAMVRWLFVTPNMHKIHHSRVLVETDSNYSNIFSVWDRLFATHTPATDYRALRYGLDGFDDARKQSFASLMIGPFRAS